MPRCSAYHAESIFGSLALRNTPPTPTARAIVTPPAEESVLAFSCISLVVLSSAFRQPRAQAWAAPRVPAHWPSQPSQLRISQLSSSPSYSRVSDLRTPDG